MIVLLYRYGRLEYIELCGFKAVIFQAIFDRAQIAQRREHTFSVVKQLHIFENINLNFFKCNMFPAVNAFLFYRCNVTFIKPPLTGVRADRKIICYDT